MCGAEPGRTPLRDYLGQWRAADRATVCELLMTSSAAAGEAFERHGGWRTNAARRELEGYVAAAEACAGLACGDFRSHLTPRDRRTLDFDTDCVFCGTPPGWRPAGEYFTVWADACAVQTGNLIYETALVLWAVLSSAPRWSGVEDLSTIDAARLALHGVIHALRRMICPQCGRPVTTLGGGTGDPEVDGWCRWCWDMAQEASGHGLVFRLKLTESDGARPAVELIEGDPRAPARNDRDLLPPEIQLRRPE